VAYQLIEMIEVKNNDIEWWEDEERVDQSISGILKTPSKMISLQRET
jgi:phage baseplate assembly protein W